jgi:Cu/Ag efflux protein CusF
MIAPLRAQDAAQPPRSSGTVTATSATGLTLKTTAGDVTVAVPAAAKVLVVPPGSKDLKAATAGSLSDVATGDKAIVTGTAGDAAGSLTAVRVILMKADAIAQTHAAEDAAWAKGGGGLVKSVDAAAGKIMISSGMKMTTVLVTRTTIVRRYSGDSVRFADAKLSTLAMVHPGDQLRVRGAKSADGLTVTADELVAGTFRNYSGLIASIDAAAGTITLKDLTTKKTVTVAVTSSSDVHRLPPMLAMRVAAQMKGGAAGAPAGAPPAGAGAPGGGYGGPGGPPSDAARAGRAGMDLSAMLSRLPAETLSGLKVGEAVMIVATTASAESDKSTAVTLLTGVDAVLAASPSGQATTLTPWSIGGGGEMGGEGGGMGPQ